MSKGSNYLYPEMWGGQSTRHITQFSNKSTFKKKTGGLIVTDLSNTTTKCQAGSLDPNWNKPTLRQPD